jgi:hypothetical protein
MSIHGADGRRRARSQSAQITHLVSTKTGEQTLSAPLAFRRNLVASTPTRLNSRPRALRLRELVASRRRRHILYLLVLTARQQHRRFDKTIPAPEQLASHGHISRTPTDAAPRQVVRAQYQTPKSTTLAPQPRTHDTRHIISTQSRTHATSMKHNTLIFLALFLTTTFCIAFGWLLARTCRRLVEAHVYETLRLRDAEALRLGLGQDEAGGREGRGRSRSGSGNGGSAV